MAELNKETLAAAEKAVEAVQEESLTDLMPAGGLMIGSYPARGLAAADFKIVQRVVNSCIKSGMELDGEDIAIVIIYAATRVEKSEIVQLWRDAHNAEGLWDKIIEWMTEFDADQLGVMVQHAVPLLDEFSSVSAVVESAGGNDNPGE